MNKGQEQRLSKIQKCILIELLAVKEKRIAPCLYRKYTKYYGSLKDKVVKKLGKWVLVKGAIGGDYLRVDGCFTVSFSRSIRNLHRKKLIVYDEKSAGGNIDKVQLTPMGVEKALKVKLSLVNFKQRIKVSDVSGDSGWKVYFVAREKLKGMSVYTYRKRQYAQSEEDEKITF